VFKRFLISEVFVINYYVIFFPKEAVYLGYLAEDDITLDIIYIALIYHKSHAILEFPTRAGIRNQHAGAPAPLR
jgi:hypothetical protein